MKPCAEGGEAIVSGLAPEMSARSPLESAAAASSRRRGGQNISTSTYSSRIARIVSLFQCEYPKIQAKRSTHSQTIRPNTHHHPFVHVLTARRVARSVVMSRDGER